MHVQHHLNRLTAWTLDLLWLCGAMALGAAIPGLAYTPTATPQAPIQGLFRSPTHVALDAQGSLYVTDSRAGKLLKLGNNGTVLATVTGLVKPLGVAVGNQNRVYVGEEGTGRVLVYDTTLTNTPSVLGGGFNEFQLPSHIAVDTTQGNGWIYVADSRTNQIRCYSNTTLVATIGAPGTNSGQFAFPAGLYVSPARELYVVDQNNDRVQVFNSTGAYQRAFSLRTPADVVTTNFYGRGQDIVGDSAGHLYVTDVFQDEIKVFDTQGNYTNTFSGFGEWRGQLRTPGSVALGSDSRLFVTSLNNNRIEVFTVVGSALVGVALQVSPSGRPAAVGETLTFQIAITNTSDAVVNSVTLTNTFRGSQMTFLASIPPTNNTAPAGAVSWTNIGPLAAGGSTVITAQFSVVASGVGTNTVIAVPVTNGIPGSAATATLLQNSVNPQVGVTKTLVSPSGRPAAVGEPLVFQIAVTNAGDVTLDTVPVADTFNNLLMTYSNATPVPTATVSNRLNWANAGPLGVGAGTVITARFTAVASGLGTNAAGASPILTNSVPVAGVTNTAAYSVVSPGIAVSKTLLSPVGRAAGVGETLVFRIALTNTGNVALDTVPVTDTFNSTLMTFSSATPAPNTNGVNFVTWTNAGPIGVGGFTVITSRFVAAASGTGTNSAATTPSTANAVPVRGATNSVLHSNVWLTLTIASAYGSPAPARGVWTNLYGAVVTNSVDAAVPGTATQFVCIGWAMTGNGPASGGSNVMVMTQTNSAVLNWQWKTQYWLAVTAGTNGTVAATNGWWDAGSATAASATPFPYYRFLQWSGTLTSTNNPLFLTMNQPHTLLAQFAANLATNGVPQWWLASFGLTNGWDAAALDDQDGDGAFTWQEWQADTVPTNPASYLGVSGLSPSGAGAVLTWHGGLASTQYVERADNLNGAPVQWLTILTNPPPTAVSTNWTDPANTNALIFYRIRAAR